MRRPFTLLLWILVTSNCPAQGENHVEPVLPDLLQLYPGIRDFTMSPVGDEVYVTAQSLAGDVSVILRVTRQDNSWAEPVIAPFSGGYHDLEPFLSPDGLKLYFASSRPLTTLTDSVKDYDIWYVTRESAKEEWSAPFNLGAPVNSEFNEFYPAVAGNGNLYFTSDREGSTGRDDIFFSAWQHGRYSTPVPLSDSINTEGYEYNAYVSPDETLLLFGAYNRPEGFGSGDIYLSRRRMDGSWSMAENMGPGVNSAQMDYCPYIHLESFALYFTSKRSNVSLDSVHTAQDLRRELNRYENGMSRIYRIQMALNKGQGQR